MQGLCTYACSSMKLPHRASGQFDLAYLLRDLLLQDHREIALKRWLIREDFFDEHLPAFLACALEITTIFSSLKLIR